MSAGFLATGWSFQGVGTGEGLGDIMTSLGAG